MDRRRIISLDAEDVARALARIPLLDVCSERDRAEIAARAHMLSFSDGDVIVPEGEEGLGFYVILSGEATIVREGREVGTLEAGDFFGEIALIEGRPRTATVVAVGRTTCVGILRSFFRPLLVRNPRLALRILEEEGRRADRVSSDPGASPV